MRDVIGATAEAASVPGVVKVEGERRVDANSRVQAFGRLPRTVTHSGDGFFLYAGNETVNKTGEGFFLDIGLGIVGGVVGGWAYDFFVGSRFQTAV
jgi:hypothetical protein